MSKTYDFQTYATQGGGLAEWDDLNKRYIWVESPEQFPDMEVGDPVPEEWGIVPLSGSNCLGE